MSLLSEFYIASPDQAINYNTDPNLPDGEKAEFEGLTIEECADLWAILQAVEPKPEFSAAFETILSENDGETLINRFPSDFVARLATLNKATSVAAAEKLIQTGEFEFLSSEVDDVLPIIEALSHLARAAQLSGKSLYLWMSV